MSLRPLDAADIPGLAAILAQLPLMARYGRTAESIGTDLATALARGDGLLVYEENGDVRGLGWFFTTGTLGMGGYLRLIAVSPLAHGKGIGSTLLAAYEKATAAASRHAFLLCSDFNVDAQRFYERHGYVKVGALPKLVRPDIDEWIYWKRLA